jgi:hypothetical protein
MEKSVRLVKLQADDLLALLMANVEESLIMSGAKSTKDYDYKFLMEQAVKLMCIPGVRQQFLHGIDAPTNIVKGEINVHIQSNHRRDRKSSHSPER